MTESVQYEGGEQFFQRLADSLNGIRPDWNPDYGMPHPRYAGIFWSRGGWTSLHVREGEETVTVVYSQKTTGNVGCIEQFGFTVEDIAQRAGVKIGRVIDRGLA